MKFERNAPVRIAHLSDIDVLVTDTVPPDPIVAICREAEVRVEIAAEDTA